MQSFGERLRHERETRNTTIEEISAATGIHRGFLEALEKNEFASLPGGAFGKFYLRAYAEILDFDPEPLIVHYDRERHRDPPEAVERRPDEPTLRRVEASLAQWRASHGGRKNVGRVVEVEDEPEEESEEEFRDVEVAAEQPVEISEPVIEPDHGGREVVETAVEEPEPVVALPEPEAVPEPVELEHAQSVPAVEELKPNTVSTLGAARRRVPHKLAATVAIVGVGLAVAIYFAVRPSPLPPPAPAPIVGPPAASVPQTAVAAPAPIPVKPPVLRPKRVDPPAEPSVYTVSDFGVGLSGQTARVAAPAEPFHEGDVVAFSTRVVGGRAGQSIRHVWIHGGRAVQSIRLRVGASDWRTHSTKTLWGAGSWSVEARDESGQVLARAAFDCERKAR